MTSHSPRSFAARFALVGLIAALMVGFAAMPAFAATVNATPDSELPETAEVEVAGTGYAASTQYRLGLCSAEPYGMFGIPACGQFETVVSNGAGNISATLEVEKENTNVHASIMPPFNLGQPPSFTCAGEAGDDTCEVVIATHGGAPSVLAGEVVSFE